MGYLSPSRPGGYAVQSQSGSFTQAESTSANTWGGWVEVYASTNEDVNHVSINLGIISGSGLPFTVDIDVGIGPSGSEVRLIENLVLQRGSLDIASYGINIPIRIPKGSRLSMRARNRYTTSLLKGHINVQLYQCGESLDEYIGDRFIHLGNVVSDSDGNPGGGPGAWRAVTSSSPKQVKAFWVGGDPNGNIGTDATNYYMEFAIGEAGEERNILGPIMWRGSPYDYIFCRPYGPIPSTIPKGERISVRHWCGTTNATDRKIMTHLWGIL